MDLDDRGRILIDQKEPYLVSACLLGKACRYDGNSSSRPLPAELLKNIEAIAVCPECLGGMEIPRPPAEIAGGDGEGVLMGKAEVVDRDGRNRTEAFLTGAAKVLETAKSHGIKGAILKARSPSCGHGQIYDGSFGKRLVDGDGVTTALLKREGIRVWTEDEWKESHKKS